MQRHAQKATNKDSLRDFLNIRFNSEIGSAHSFIKDCLSPETH